MAEFNWAYVDCDDTLDTIGGTSPTGGILFVTGARGATGSLNFMYYTASTYSYAPNTVVLSGNLIVTGAISASMFTVENIIHIDATGSTYFGNTDDDEHVRTGSFIITPAGAGTGDNYTLSASVVDGRTSVRAFSGRYTKVTATNYVIGTDQYILGCSHSAGASQTLYLPTASVVGAGALLIIKDQYQTRADTSVFISASANAHQSVDAETFYQLTGTMAAINLYSDGSNWFVF